MKLAAFLILLACTVGYVHSQPKLWNQVVDVCDRALKQTSMADTGAPAPTDAQTLSSPAPVPPQEVSAPVTPPPVTVAQTQAAPPPSNDLDINAAPNDLDGPSGFHTDTRVVTDEPVDVYVSDLDLVRQHLRIDPATGKADGDPYYVRKYEEDRRHIAQHDVERENHRGTAENNVPSPAFHENDPLAPEPHDAFHGDQHGAQPATTSRSPGAAPRPPPPRPPPSRPVPPLLPLH